MTWLDRTNKQKDAERKFEELCRRKDVSLARSGIEQLLQDSKFKEKLDKLDDESSKRLRFFPDFIMLGKKGWLVEVKDSKTIEKTAYDVYMDLSIIGYNVALAILATNSLRAIIEHNTGFLFVNIEELKIKEQRNNPYIKDGKEWWTVGRPPVFNNKWTAPRGNPEWTWTKNWTEENYYKWKEKTGGSGTTYGNIDFKNTNFENFN